MSSRDNNFDFLRLVGAVLVLVSHQFALHGDPEPVVGRLTTLGGLGVAMFFSMSGYLITLSWQRDPHWGRFALRRCLRILPGLVVVVALCVLVLGPMVTSLAVEEYLRAPEVRAYWRNIVLYPVYALPGVFTSNPYPHAVNGSLWTLPFEFLLYFAIVPVLCLKTIRLYPWLLLVAALGLTAVGRWFFSAAPPVVVYGSDLRYLGILAPYFLMGSAWALWGGSTRLSLPVAVAAVGGLVVFHGVLEGMALQLVAAIVIPYATLSVGVRSWPGVRRAARWGDISYGMYIYAFPMQQTSIWLLGEGATFGSRLLLASGLTLGCALFSWHWVERPFLAFKPSVSAVRRQVLDAPS